MARIAGVDLPDQKRIDIGLTAIYGIGRSNVALVLKKAQVDSAKRVKDLSRKEVSQLQEAVSKMPTEGALRQKISDEIKRLKVVGAYRGLRHSHNLPARGQRTRSNARTKRGRRQTVGALKKMERIKQETQIKTEVKEKGSAKTASRD